MAAKNHQVRLYEKQLMLIGIPVFLSAFFMGVQLYNQPFWIAIKSLGQMLLLALAVWSIVRFIIARFRQRYPHYHQAMRRLLLTIAVSGILSMGIAFMILNVPGAYCRQAALISIAVT